MKRISGNAWCMVAVAATMAVAAPVTARADMMSTCQGDIASQCSGVSNGRGRISACLFSKSSKLSAACKSEIDAVAKKSQSNILVPGKVRSLMGAGAAPAVPAACSADRGSVCSGADAGDRNMLACLYAYSSKLSANCASAVQAAL